MIEFDPGPPPAFAELFAQAPDYGPFRKSFWYDWGPVFYRGRLDGSARVLCIASDPGPTERLLGRTLVGDAGQRVQGFLTKIGLTRSYLCLNAHLYALRPSYSRNGTLVLNDPIQLSWRNKLYSKAKRRKLQAILAFGSQAQEAVRLLPGKGNLPVLELPHPSSRNSQKLVSAWKAAVTLLRESITPDPDGDPTVPNYGNGFREADYTRIPYRDLPFGPPVWMGDDSWGRSARPRHNNSVKRPVPDDLHTLIWIAPKS